MTTAGNATTLPQVPQQQTIRIEDGTLIVGNTHIDIQHIGLNRVLPLSYRPATAGAVLTWLVIGLCGSGFAALIFLTLAQFSPSVMLTLFAISLMAAVGFLVGAIRVGSPKTFHWHCHQSMIDGVPFDIHTWGDPGPLYAIQAQIRLAKLQGREYKPTIIEIKEVNQVFGGHNSAFTVGGTGNSPTIQNPPGPTQPPPGSTE